MVITEIITTVIIMQHNYTNGWFSQDHPDGNVNDDVILNIDDDGDIIGKYSE